MTITVSTDGSALGNPNGPMGWAWADHTPHAGGQPGHEHPGDCDAGGATNGTNQIGELCAVLEALRAHPGSEPLVIETDSQYAINCSTKWVHGWKRNGWKNSQKKPVKNAALIKAIDAELSKRAGSVKFVWVKGHAGNAGNEKVDELARTYAADCRSGARDGYLPLEGWQALIASEYADGLDVPSDARLLLDGAISAKDYHLGRGADAAETVALPPHDQPTAAMPKGSLADRLAEPEGVPDYGFDGADDASATVTVTRRSLRSGGAQDDVDTEVEPQKAQPAEPAAGMTQARDEGAERPDDAASAAGTPPVAENTQGSGSPAARRRTGLGVSGTLRFDPPPESSPTYDGRPRFIRGVIVVEGYVQGDGTMTLEDAEFRVRRS